MCCHVVFYVCLLIRHPNLLSLMTNCIGRLYGAYHCQCQFSFITVTVIVWISMCSVNCFVTVAVASKAKLLICKTYMIVEVSVCGTVLSI